MRVPCYSRSSGPSENYISISHKDVSDNHPTLTLPPSVGIPPVDRELPNAVPLGGLLGFEDGRAE